MSAQRVSARGLDCLLSRMTWEQRKEEGELPVTCYIGGRGVIVHTSLVLLATRGNMPLTPKAFQVTRDGVVSSRCQLGRAPSLRYLVHSDLGVGCSGYISYSILLIFNELLSPQHSVL